jgi:hypothetical protein
LEPQDVQVWSDAVVQVSVTQFAIAVQSTQAMSAVAVQAAV